MTTKAQGPPSPIISSNPICSSSPRRRSTPSPEVDCSSHFLRPVPSISHTFFLPPAPVARKPTPFFVLVQELLQVWAKNERGWGREEAGAGGEQPPVQGCVELQHLQLRRRLLLGLPIHPRGRVLRLVPAILCSAPLCSEVRSYLRPRSHGRMRQCRYLPQFCSCFVFL